MKPLTVEIHGTGTHNRGAELMALAIAERMRTSFPGVRIVVPPSFGSFESRAQYRFFTTPEVRGGLITRILARMAPRKLKDIGGLIDPSEIDVVLDASGFAFSDQWGQQPAMGLWNKMNRPRRRHQLLVLLPQALGPFKIPAVAAAARLLSERATLICARDKISFAEMSELCDGSRLRLFPDFTVGIRPQLPEGLNLPARFSAIIPNIRMLDKTKSADAYLGLLCHAVKGLQARELNPVFVLHDAAEDRRVIKAVEERGHSIPILEHSDPRVLKGILGKATLVIGSRFHGLVGALSQGIPSIGVGWSHKYPELFADFDSNAFIVSDLTDMNTLDQLLNDLADTNTREERKQRIQAAAARVKSRTSEMWGEVESKIKAHRSVA